MDSIADKPQVVNEKIGMRKVSPLQAKVNEIVGAGLSSSSFDASFGVGGGDVLLRLGGCDVEKFWDFVQALDVDEKFTFLCLNDDTIRVSLPDDSDCAYRVYGLIADWASGHDVDISFGDGLSGDVKSIPFCGDIGQENPSENPSLDKMVDVGISDRSDSIYEAFVKAGMVKQAEHYLNCGHERYMLECCKCGYQHVVTEHCKLRACAHCGVVRSIEVRKAYQWYVESVSPDRLRLFTFTIKNVSNLAAGVDRIRKCFTRLRHRKIGRGIFGGLYGIEAVPDGEGLWNVHLHALVEGVYIPQKKLSQAWLSITGDSPVVFIQKVKGGAKRALGYVTKYVAKGIDLDNTNWTPELLVEFVLALENVRLIQAFGSFLGKKSEPPPMVCPVCGESVWRLLSLDSEVVIDALGRLRSEWKRFVVEPIPYADYKPLD